MTKFIIEKNRFYHLPHNSVIVDEFNFMVSKLDISKKYYKTSELQKLFLIKQIQENKFEIFHKTPYKNFTESTPPDIEKLRKKFENLENEVICPKNTLKIVYDKVQELGPDDALNWFLEQRRVAFATFVSNPDKHYDQFISTPYTTQKVWKYNWAEFVRDYIQFLSHIGIIPAYYKGWGRENKMSGSGDVGFVISKLGEKYINNKIELGQLLMGYKYRNALINLDQYEQYARKVRPFYASIKLLWLFKNAGVLSIERNLLAGFISTIMEEKEIYEITKSYSKILKNDNKNYLMSVFPSIDDGFKKEIGRFALPLIKFLEGSNLISIKRVGQKNYISITEYGENIIKNEPQKIAVSNDTIGDLKLTPIVGYILKYFADTVKNNTQTILVEKIYSSSELLKSLLEKDKFIDLLEDIKNTVENSPIDKITDTEIILNGLETQFSINSSVDFSDIYDSSFVEGAQITPKTQEIVRVEKSTLLEETIKSLTEAALGSDGEKYENELYTALTHLIGPEYVFQMGNVGTRAQRLSDTVWKVPIIFDDQEKKLLVVFEAKAGNAISSFDERKEKDDLKRTIAHFSDELVDVAGIWYMVVDSKKLPENRHGGFRGGNSLSFEEKLHDIQSTVLMTVNKPVIVSAMNIYSFTEYYKYLFQITRGFGDTFTAFNDVVVPNFWLWGNLFHPIKSYSQIYNDQTVVKHKLRTQYE